MAAPVAALHARAWLLLQIASMVTLQGQSSPIVRNVMTLGTCASIVGSEVMCFDE